MGHLLIIEGNIGIGKSTLSKNISENFGYKLFKEPVEDNPYLEKFYKEPKRWALEMQFWLMSHRFIQHQEAIEYIWTTGNSACFDRSIHGDLVFCKRNYLDGNIDELGYANYLKMHEVMTRFLMIPQITIFLDAKPEICLERIKQRNRNCECTIPLQYLCGLQDLYTELVEYLKNKGSKVIKINWNEFMPFEEVFKYLKDIMGETFKNYPKIKKVK